MSAKKRGTSILPLRDSGITRDLTSKLSGARPHQIIRSYFIPTHRFPPTINEDDAACPLQRKLDISIDMIPIIVTGEVAPSDSPLLKVSFSEIGAAISPGVLAQDRPDSNGSNQRKQPDYHELCRLLPGRITVGANQPDGYPGVEPDSHGYRRRKEYSFHLISSNLFYTRLSPRANPTPGANHFPNNCAVH
jgi:hypothetical protein